LRKLTIEGRRSRRREGFFMGYRTSVPVSLWVLEAAGPREGEGCGRVDRWVRDMNLDLPSTGGGG